MTFVDDHVNPLDPAQKRPLLDNVLVRRQTHLEVDGTQARIGLSTDSRRSLEDKSTNGRSPALKLHGPVGKGGKRDDDKEGTRLLLFFNEVSDQRYCLDSFTKTL